MGIIALIAVAGATVAVPGSIDFDVQCAIAAQQASEQVDESVKADLTAAVTFYMGRADVRVPAAELEDRLTIAAQALEGAPLGPLLQQCGSFMLARGKAWEDIGQRMLAREEARSRT